MEEVHDLERAKHAGDLEDEIAKTDGDLAARLTEIRESLDKLETQLADGERIGAAKRRGRPSKGGRMRG